MTGNGYSNQFPKRVKQLEKKENDKMLVEQES